MAKAQTKTQRKTNKTKTIKKSISSNIEENASFINNRVKLSKESKEKTGNNGVKNMLFTVVAIGASAGGLEAYTEIIRNINNNTGLAYVIIQHTDPSHKSYLHEILSRETELKIVTAENGMSPEPNTIYIIHPKDVLSFEDGKFITVLRKKTNHIHLPINIFMRSLAEDNTHYCIGIILSGTDSDGVIGLEFIRACGGITFAQNESTAKFPDMPRNAINADVVDFVLSPAEIANELNSITKNRYLDIRRKNDPIEILPGSEAEINKIFAMLEANKKINFKNYKPTTIKRRILRRMLFHKIPDISGYVGFLKKEPKEIELLYDDMLINVTSFFRDPGLYESLRKNIFPGLFRKRDRDNPVRIWIPGCSTGEEVYSFAILIAEYLGRRFMNIPVQIFATDLSERCLEKARAGIYSHGIIQDVSYERLRKFFVKKESEYQVTKAIRNICIFARQNLIQEPPFSKIDLVSCRNVLIYFGHLLQEKIIPTFHFALKNTGYLILGTSESVGSVTELFELVDKKNKIYRKKITAKPATLPSINITPVPALKNEGVPAFLKSKILKDDYRKSAEALILNKFSPASLIIDSSYNIIHLRGRIDSFIQFPQGEPSYNLLKVARKGISIEIRALIKKTGKEKGTVVKNNIEISVNGYTKRISISVVPLDEKEKSRKLYLVVFHEVSGNNENRGKKSNLKEDSDNSVIKGLKKELVTSNENVQSGIEQLETANEELMSANEEIQSSNEELQSTNEELETAKEELQSTNEELTTVNEELQNRNSELGYVNNDLKSFLASINIPLLILDGNFNIRRFTNSAEKLLNINIQDLGRKITSIKTHVLIPDFERILSDVINTPAKKEVEVRGYDKCWYSMRIRPYLSPENKLEGVIIAFIDITDLKSSFVELEKSRTEISKLNIGLEKRVDERTKQFIKLNENLEEEIKERKNMEQTLRILSKHLVTTQETERQRLSRELHDSVNQILSVVKMKLYSSGSVITSTGNNKDIKDFSQTITLLDKAIAEIRTISKNLRPMSLEDLSLKSALQSFIDEYRQRTKMSVNFKMDNFKKKLSSEKELNIYRIIQEALHNIERHSKARSVKILIENDIKNILLKIKDNGIGFDILTGRVRNAKLSKFGLIGMKERAESVGGKFDIKSAPGKGTEINFSMPFHELKD